MLDKFIADLRNVYQTVLVDADIHEHAEVDDVADSAGEHHARLQILHVQHVGAQDGSGQVVPHVPTGLQQLLHHVPQGGQADAQIHDVAVLQFFGAALGDKAFDLGLFHYFLSPSTM